jgi:hypothetical protein
MTSHFMIVVAIVNLDSPSSSLFAEQVRGEFASPKTNEKTCRP